MISYVEKEVVGTVNIRQKITIVNLLTVYDKTERETITDSELKKLIESLQP